MTSTVRSASISFFIALVVVTGAVWSIRYRLGPIAFPKRDVSTSPQIGHDWDGDGRADLFLFRKRESDSILRVQLLSGIDAPTQATSEHTSDVLEYRIEDTGSIPFVADFDGDGRSDFATWEPIQTAENLHRAGNWQIILSSERTDATAEEIQSGLITHYYKWGVPGTVPIVADLNSDGRMDLGSFSPSKALWQFALNNNGFDSATAQLGLQDSGLSFECGDHFGTPIVGDVTVDGQVDFGTVAIREGLLHWEICHLSNGILRGTPQRIDFGLENDVPLRPKTTSKGPPIFRVYRPSSGEILTSNNDNKSSPSFVDTRTGDAFDSDLDGDGFYDLIVYHADSKPHFRVIPNRITKEIDKSMRDLLIDGFRSDLNLRSGAPPEIIQRRFYQQAITTRRE